MLYKHIGLALVSFVLLSGCSVIKGQFSLVFVPIHIDTVRVLDNQLLASETLHQQGSIGSEGDSTASHRPDHLTVSDDEIKLLQDAFVVAIAEPAYQIISGEAVRSALNRMPEEPEVAANEVSEQALRQTGNNRALQVDSCRLLVCQQAVAAMFDSERVAYAYVGIEGDDYLFSITLTNTRNGSYKTKSGRCYKCNFMELVHQVRRMEHFQHWSRGRPHHVSSSVGGGVFSDGRNRGWFQGQPSSANDSKPLNEAQALKIAAFKARTTRSAEEVLLTVESHKARLQAIYQRARLSNSLLAGTVVFELMVAGNGDVLEAEVVTSELGDAALERKLIKEIGQLKFSSKPVARMIITLPLDFHPAN